MPITSFSLASFCCGVQSGSGGSGCSAGSASPVAIPNKPACPLCRSLQARWPVSIAFSISAENAMETGQRAWRDRQSGQAGLFGMATGEAEPAEHPLPPLPDWTPQQKLASEKEVIGIYVTGHPLDEYSAKVSELATHSTET